ncbi:hypothetical protein CC85DRAFT_285941 [Cutaneotrichosporon oleaginosum]|uniref:Uncharacterized protein n=1 Tax=Cutaneotrichosporon oleaginosum TaxID=879819 RepID=A0A0J0XLR2_9TREE|nr:uncharacterized protein CC85DRAFT_285941 [Cutaneotrichosporon oleaginosum]KLT42008.1 hypothetical protein CC85DRAFT_285941 [Cutaneotrichosporon oleaginosum]TXT14335.1 hypothetical protein COLE_00528 [Cutaneotrichosporon oleaginosum]
MAQSWIVALSLLAITAFIVAVMTTIRYFVKARSRRRAAAAPAMLALPSTTTLASQTTLVQTHPTPLPLKSSPV